MSKKCRDGSENKETVFNCFGLGRTIKKRITKRSLFKRKRMSGRYEHAFVDETILLRFL